jgi:hypothetical protein
MVLESKHGQMEHDIQDNSKMTNLMAKVYSIITMEIFMTENGKMTKLMEGVSILKTMEQFMKVIG